MIGVEIDLVVKDSLEALRLYESVFDLARVEVTSFDRGQNEAIFTMYGGRFHLLDENPDFHLLAPTPGVMQSMWVNLLVEDIQVVYDKAVAAGMTVIQPLTEMTEMGVSNAVVVDPFGYAWMFHQIHRQVSFEERVEHLTSVMG